jgi:hypothetical protein
VNPLCNSEKLRKIMRDVSISLFLSAPLIVHITIKITPEKHRTQDLGMGVWEKWIEYSLSIQSNACEKVITAGTGN